MENRLGKKMHIVVLHKNCYSAENMIQSLKGNLLTGITAFPQLSGFSLKISFSLTVATHTTYSQLSHKTYPKPIQNLSKTCPKPVQNLSKSFSLYTLYTRIQLFSIFFHHFSQYQYRYQSAVYLVLCFYKKTCARLDQHREEQLLYNSSCHAFALTINHNISSLSYQVNRLLTVT